MEAGKADRGNRVSCGWLRGDELRRGFSASAATIAFENVDREHAAHKFSRWRSSEEVVASVMSANNAAKIRELKTAFFLAACYPILR